MSNEVNSSVLHLSSETDSGVGAKARIGLLVLESDQTLEWEMRQIFANLDIGLYHSRLANDTIVTSDSLAKMEVELPKAAALLPPYLGFQAIGYGCTSGATIIGEERVGEIIAQTHRAVPSSNPLSAAIVALKALNVRRLGLVTPYVPQVTLSMQEKIEESGIRVSNIGSFYEDDDTRVGRISQASIKNAILSVGSRDEVDGVFVSCTSLRAAGVIDKAEAQLNKPITASNHALAWHLLRLAGVTDKIEGFGRLFRL